MILYDDNCIIYEVSYTTYDAVLLCTQICVYICKGLSHLFSHYITAVALQSLPCFNVRTASLTFVIDRRATWQHNFDHGRRDLT